MPICDGKRMLRRLLAFVAAGTIPVLLAPTAIARSKKSNPAAQSRVRKSVAPLPSKRPASGSTTTGPPPAASVLPDVPAATSSSSSSTVSATTTSAVTSTSITTTTLVVEANTCGSTGAVPPILRLDPFYTKYCAVRAMPVVSATAVSDAAMAKAGVLLERMLSPLPVGVVEELLRRKIHFGIIGLSQQTIDMPEYRNLYTLYPGTDWNVRARGLGATIAIPLSSVGEENLLCLTTDKYLGQSILVHEFAHTIKDLGLDAVVFGFRDRVRIAYAQAMERGLWAKTYAATNVQEYWAVGVQSYFDAARESSPPNGVYNEINTRSELSSYDPDLYSAIADTFGADPLPVRC